MRLQGNGDGLTTLIQRTQHEADLDESLINLTLLEALNKVFGPDGHFDRIVTKRSQGNIWEIFLEEAHKGPIALSSSGSGLKTIILVLAELLVAPEADGIPIDRYIFGFEEIENNLHPGLQRRLFSFIRDFAVESGATVFLTTHSSVVIDLFSTDSEAQLLHVVHEGATASVRPLAEYVDHRDALRDLDVRG